MKSRSQFHPVREGDEPTLHAASDDADRPYVCGWCDGVVWPTVAHECGEDEDTGDLYDSDEDAA